MASWTFYIVRNGECTYAGISVDVHRRLRQHNGQLSGGARYTTSRGPGWKHVCLVRGFENQNQALMFEWAVKNAAPRKHRGVIARLQKFYSILKAERWTSRSPDACTVPLEVEVCDYDTFALVEQPVLPDYISFRDVTCDEDELPQLALPMPR